MEPDYKKMWDELCVEINALHKGYIDAERSIRVPTCEYLKGCKFGIELCGGLMNKIREKYQPKQYTWNEILEMNPLPKKIKSEFECEYKLNGDSTEYYRVVNCVPYNASIQEMKNKWTIVEE